MNLRGRDQKKTYKKSENGQGDPNLQGDSTKRETIGGDYYESERFA